MTSPLDDHFLIKEYLIECLKNDKKIIQAHHPHPCGICQKNVNRNQKAIECTTCMKWVHIRCDGTTADEYRIMIETNQTLTEEQIINTPWECNKCKIAKLATIFPFGYETDHSLININNTDSLDILERIPSYEICSNVCQIESLSANDPDNDIVDRIDSRYLSAHEFKKINKPKSFSIVHNNLNGLEHKFDLLQQFINSTEFDIDVICISETSQREDIEFASNVHLNGYKDPVSLGSKSAKGGVAIYTKCNLKIKRRIDLDKVDNSFEIVWVEIQVDKSKNILIGCAYRHPNGNIDDFITYTSKCIKKINKEKKECYLSGDFNQDLLKFSTINKTAEFINTMTSLNLLPTILQPTRVTDHSFTIIDNIFSNSFDKESISGNILMLLSDHFPQFLIIDKNIPKLKKTDLFKRDMSNFNEQDFIDDISIQNWNSTNFDNVNDRFNDFTWRIEGCVDRHAPLKKCNKKQINKKNKPWINDRILKMIRLKERYFHAFKSNPLEHGYKLLHNRFRNRITREIRQAKKDYYKNYFHNNLNDMKKTWTGINELVNIRSKNRVTISQINYKGKTLNDNTDMANAFNDFFTNVGPNLDAEIPICQKPNGSTLYLSPRIPRSIFISPTDSYEIKDIISNLDDTKSSGPSPIPTKLLKLAADELSTQLADICNMSFLEGSFPDKNKIAEVIPIHKKGSTEDTNNYRPISLLSIFSKIMEKLMATRLRDYLDLLSIIYPKQFGFRPGFSTSHSLVDITETIRGTLEKKKYGCGIFIDLKKAFDTVNHKILLQKLEHYGIRGNTLLWFKSYLTNRKQYVNLNGTKSDTKEITCGVPQGSVLGPLLFLLYINDLPNISEKLTFFLFADDTNIYFESDNLDNLQKIINKELKKLYEWLCINRLSLNISKTNFVIFHAKNKPLHPITILINNKAIEEADHVKYLGVIIDSQLTFRRHMEEVSKKISRSIGVLYKLRPFVSQKILVNVYYAIIYPFLLYGVELWGNTSNTLLTPIFLLQKKFVRLATYNDNYIDEFRTLAHSFPLFYTLKIMTIFDIFRIQLGTTVFDAVNMIGPQVIEITPASQIHHYNTKFAQADNHHVNYVRTTTYGIKALKNEGIKLWKTIPSNIKSAKSKKSFKNNYKKHLINFYASL